MEKKFITASVPVILDCPFEMLGSIDEVLKGEYETGYFGEHLTILDIGANVGSFALWANMRYPKSKIYAFEPHPETFKMLTSNVQHLDNIICHNVAVYPSNNKTELLYTRYAGDGESGLAGYIDKIFDNLNKASVFEVPVFHPSNLPKADIVKIDTEGAEFPILSNMELSGTSLILLEYHLIQDRDAIKKLLQDFVIEQEDNFEWSETLQFCKDVLENVKKGVLDAESVELKRLLNTSTYKENLSGNYHGRLFFANKQIQKLKKYSSFSFF